ncbi:MAG: hypothetical protein WAO58_01255 [Fimbriimonadaceae bacterium]
MFPFLPALILLLLNGPSGLDRPQHDAGLPEAIRALHRHVRQGSDRAEQKVRNFESDLVMASLIAASGDGELGKVVQELLQMIGEVAPTDLPDRAFIDYLTCITTVASRRIEGPDLNSDRTRDGPVSR